jgi:hypothetical protein
MKRVIIDGTLQAKLYTPPPFLVDSWFIPKLLVDS